MSRILITIGLLLVLLGLIWPWLAKSGLGRLPGDLIIRRENFTFYFPITTSILFSLLFTFLLWLFRR